MEQLKLRVAQPEDSTQLVEWLNNTPHYDPDILGYKSLAVLCAYNGEPVAYLPVQKVLMLESVATKPGENDLVLAQAMRDMVKGAELTASSQGIREVYFLGSDPDVVKIAESHGFQELPWKVLRLKLS